jgi:hypothetical protein
MNDRLSCAHPHRPIPRLHARFLALVPRIELHGHIYFRHLRSHEKADAIQEMLALAWQWFLRLRRRGRDPNDFVMGFVRLLAKAVNSGRRLTGQMKAREVLNPTTQRRHRFSVEPLPDLRAGHDRLYSPGGQRLHDAFEEQLRDNTVTPIPDQVQFRLDWPAWLTTRTDRDRRLIRAMARSERTLDLSRKFGLSPARISQLRGQYQADWTRFCHAD